MTKPNENGGPALTYEGMSLLEYYAGQALAGLASKPNAVGSDDDEAAAQACFDIAEAMVRERNKRTAQ